MAEPSTVDYGETRDFAAIMLENLRMSGVQQARRSDRITFSSVTGWRVRTSAPKATTRTGTDPGARES